MCEIRKQRVCVQGFLPLDDVTRDNTHARTHTHTHTHTHLAHDTEQAPAWHELVQYGRLGVQDIPDEQDKVGVAKSGEYTHLMRKVPNRICVLRLGLKTKCLTCAHTQAWAKLS